MTLRAPVYRGDYLRAAARSDGRWCVQRREAGGKSGKGLDHWYDVGDPCDSMAEAVARLNQAGTAGVALDPVVLSLE